MLTTAVAAERLGLSQKTIQALIKQNRLKATLFGKTYLIDEADLKRYKSRPVGRPTKNGHAKNGHTKPAPRKRSAKLRNGSRTKVG